MNLPIETPNIEPILKPPIEIIENVSIVKKVENSKKSGQKWKPPRLMKRVVTKTDNRRFWRPFFDN